MDLDVELPAARAMGSSLLEHAPLPDSLVRFGIRLLLRKRLWELERGGETRERSFLAELAGAPIALRADAANSQHYEVPAAFYAAVLGPHMKYSSAYFASGHETLREAEAAMLALTCDRAQLEDGQRILELGCGWGSLSLWMARRYRRSEIVAVSNSHSQRRLIMESAQREGLDNLTVVTADMNTYHPEGRFDRVISVEMFEHMRNWPQLLLRVDDWLERDGALFLHVFSHRRFAYPFEDRGPGDWMARHFFTGGMMPAHGMLSRLHHPFEVKSWVVDGTHYQRTADAWLRNLYAQRPVVMPILAQAYGADASALWFQRWRLFFLACSELFGFRAGQEWWVSHHLLRPARGRSR